MKLLALNDYTNLAILLLEIRRNQIFSKFSNPHASDATIVQCDQAVDFSIVVLYFIIDRVKEVNAILILAPSTS
jgi:hypothetical protein